MAAAKKKPQRSTPPRWIELPTTTLPYWSVNEVRAALNQHEIGLLQRSSLLFEAMDRDDRIKAVMDTRVNGLLGLPVTITPPVHADMEKARYVAAIVRERWRDWFPEGDLAKLLRWSIGVGVGVGENRWQMEEGLRVPILKVWHPQFLWWRWDLNDWDGGWSLTTMGKQAGEDRIDTSPGGSIQGSGTQVQPVAGDGTWVVLQPGGRRQPWNAGLVRAFGRPYLVRGFAYRDWARWSETLGAGIKKAKVPASAKAGDKQTFFNSLGRMGANGIIMLPTSMEAGKETAFDLTLLESQSGDSGGAGFNLLIKQADTSIAILALGQNLTTEVRGGSFAAARVHENVKHDIASTDAMNLCGAIRRGSLMPFARDNFGDPTLAPVMSIEVGPPDDRKAKAQTYFTLAQALMLARGGKPPGGSGQSGAPGAPAAPAQPGLGWDETAISEDFGVPLIETAPDRDATEALSGSGGGGPDRKRKKSDP